MITKALVNAAHGMTPEIQEACETLLVMAAAEKMDDDDAKVLLADAEDAHAVIGRWLAACAVAQDDAI